MLRFLVDANRLSKGAYCPLENDNSNLSKHASLGFGFRDLPLFKE
jgi:hypothetical protein